MCFSLACSKEFCPLNTLTAWLEDRLPKIDMAGECAAQHPGRLARRLLMNWRRLHFILILSLTHYEIDLCSEWRSEKLCVNFIRQEHGYMSSFRIYWDEKSAEFMSIDQQQSRKDMATHQTKYRLFYALQMSRQECSRYSPCSQRQLSLRKITDQSSLRKYDCLQCCRKHSLFDALIIS